MTEQVRYVLHVLRAQSLTWESSFGVSEPRLYVTVRLGGITKGTSAIERDLSPEWNECITLSSADTKSILRIEVQHKPVLSADHCIGYVTIELEELLKASGNGEAALNLLPPRKKSSEGTAGTICLKLDITDRARSAATDLEALRRTVRSSGIANSTTALAPVIEGGRLVGGESDLYKYIGSILSKLEPIKRAIDDVSRVHPYLQLAWASVSILYETVDKQFKTDRKALDLCRVLEDAFEFVSDTHALRSKIRLLEQQVIELLEMTSECCQFLREYLPRSFARRMSSLGASEKIDVLMRSVREQKENLGLGLALHNAHMAARACGKIDALSLRQQLLVHETAATTRQPCQEGTRVDIRRHVIDLLGAETSPNVIWLHGVAGSGKSTIATSTEDYFRDVFQLGAFIKFERGKSEPGTVVRELAYKLALFDSSIRSRIIEHLEQDSDVASALLSRQFEKLLLEPLSAVMASNSTNEQKPVVIVLDALDECGTPSTRAELMRLLKNGFSKLPRIFRFLITSRPEPDIVNAFKPSSRLDFVHEIELDYTSEATRGDVLSYLNHEMCEILDGHPQIKLPKDWSWDVNMAALGKAAGGLFIWASTAVKLVSMSDNPFRKLKSLVSDSRSLAKFGLDELYSTVLQGSGISWDDEDSKARFSAVLASLLFSKIPLSNQDIDNLLDFPPDEPSDLILSRLRCLLSYTPGKPVHLFHASFSDYLQSPERARNPWFIDIRKQKSHLAMRCFAIMDDSLHFNMCNLETSFIRNDNVPDLKDLIKAKIPSHLEYACTFWAQHLVEVSISSCLLDALSSFAYRRLLFWFEVLSLLRNFRRIASRALTDVAIWAADDTTISAFLKDASFLATAFAEPISQSTPHVYVSLIPLARGDSEVSAHYSKWMDSMVQVEQRGAKPKPSWLKILEGHTGGITSVCFSPDGTRVVSGSVDKTIRVWDIETGDLLCDPLDGHTGIIHSIAIASDGRRVVSGSGDNTVRVWNMETGKLISGPFRGHTQAVTSVAFSPDGKYVVSGSGDSTVRLWDAIRGEAVFPPFDGHAAGVNTVAFSPIRRSVASGSYDTIRIWDMVSGRVASEVSGEHAMDTRCIAFSPDGCFIASGNGNCEVVIWDAVTGKVVSGPFVYHTGVVSSIAFSPDGKCVVSTSYDDTIKIWDLEKAEVIAGISADHTGRAACVAFSPNGLQIVSGSHDQTVRVWDVTSVGGFSEPLNTHKSAIISIAFSPDDSKIISGSLDGAITLWDVTDVSKSPRNFEQHPGCVDSLAFSPDASYIISGCRDGTVRVWDQSTSAVAFGPYEACTSWPCSISVSPDSTGIASSSDDNTFKIWDMKTGDIIAGPFVGHATPVLSVVFSPDASHIISGSEDGSLILWDTRSGDIVLGPLRDPAGHLCLVAFSPDGRCFAAVYATKVQTWSISSGDLVYELSLEQETRIYSNVAFTHDGSRLASISSDGCVRVWDMTSGQIISGPFEIHFRTICSLDFSRDGKYIAFGSWDRTIQVLDIEGRNSPSHVSVDEEDIILWTMVQDGWITSRRGELLLWIPPDLRRTLWSPYNTAMFSCTFWTKVDFRSANIGLRWGECFKPT